MIITEVNFLIWMDLEAGFWIYKRPLKKKLGIMGLTVYQMAKKGCKIALEIFDIPTCLLRIRVPITRIDDMWHQLRSKDHRRLELNELELVCVMGVYFMSL